MYGQTRKWLYEHGYVVNKEKNRYHVYKLNNPKEVDMWVNKLPLAASAVFLKEYSMDFCAKATHGDTIVRLCSNKE